MLKIGIIANLLKTNREDLQKVIDGFSDQNIFLEKETAKSLKLGNGLPLLKLAKKTELLITLGGDGTILKCVRMLGKNVIPLLGINFGRLGFLTASPADQMEDLFAIVKERKYVIKERSLLEVNFKDENKNCTYYALNEAAIVHSNIARTIMVDLAVDGKQLNRFSADGIIVATPTGSTAYSLSAGGPIIHPKASVFVITPICPHTISNRSVVINSTSTINLKTLPQGTHIENNKAILTVDGEEKNLLADDLNIEIKKAPFDLPLAFLHDRSFYQVLRQKFFWYGGLV